jgi:hypothetical protein
MTDLAAIDRLRLAVARLIDSAPPGDDLAAWFADAVARYEQGAALGLTLGRALDLERVSGARPWWQTETLRRRDALIRELAGRYFPGLPARAQARAIRRRRDLMRRLPAPVSEATLLRVLLSHQTPPSRATAVGGGSAP